MKNEIVDAVEKMLRDSGPWKSVYEATWGFVVRTDNDALGDIFLRALGGKTEDRYDLGLCFANGENGLPKDERIGLFWIWLAAEAGDGWAINNLATMVERGRGVKAIPREAFRLYQIAAEMCVPQAMRNLARCYRCGRCGGTNEEEAARLEAEANEYEDDE